MWRSAAVGCGKQVLGECLWGLVAEGGMGPFFIVISRPSPDCGTGMGNVAEHGLDTVASLVSALVMPDGLAAVFPARDAGPYPHVLKGFTEPVGVVSPVGNQPFDRRQGATQRSRADVVAHLASRDEEADWSPGAVRDGVQLGIHAALGSADQAPAPPFFTARLVAVRWAFR